MFEHLLFIHVNQLTAYIYFACMCVFRYCIYDIQVHGFKISYHVHGDARSLRIDMYLEQCILPSLLEIFFISCRGYSQYKESSPYDSPQKNIAASLFHRLLINFSYRVFPYRRYIFNLVLI